jgi:hypothetical protein
MTNEEQEVITQDDTETTENEVEDIDIELDDDTEEEVDVEALKKELLTLKAQKDHWKKKATATKQPEKVEKTENSSTLTIKDQIALAKNVDVEDIDEVVEFASYKKISISDAIKNPTLKAILSDREEQRKSAQATSTGTSRKSSQTLSDETILENAYKGKMPEMDDIDKLVKAKFK